MRAFITLFARNRIFANILIVLVVFLGVTAARNMVRELFPEFSLDIVRVTMVWPGADPEEVEEGISRKIEEAIQGIEGIKRFTSISTENQGAVLVEVLDRYDVRDVKDKVRNAVDSISNFPLDAEKPVVEELTLRREVLIVALYGESLSERDLREWAQTVKEDLRAMPGISQVKVLGARNYEISIEISEEKLREYGLSFSQVVNTVRANNLNLAAGVIRTEGKEIRLRTQGRKYTGEELAKIVVLARPSGEIITLDRVATIRDDFTEDRLISRFNGHPCVSVVVLKTQDEDMVAISRLVHEYVDRLQAKLPPGVHATVWGDNTRVLQARINLLLRNGLQGLVVVFLILWLFLDIRLSFWVGMGMPFSVLGAMGILWMAGETINMVSLFGFIMVLGIVVDDATVLGEAIYVARQRGLPPLRAAIEGTYEVAIPVLASVTTNIVTFVPLFFVSGVIGKFMRILPAVVISCFTISLFEAFVAFPAHLNDLPDPNERFKEGHRFRRWGLRFHHWTNQGLEWIIAHIYAPVLRLLIKWRYVTASFSFLLVFLAAGLFVGGVLKFELFGHLDSDVLTATVEFPEGTPITVTEEALKRVDDALLRLAEKTRTQSGAPLIRNRFMLVGGTISDDRPRYGNHLGSVRVELLPSQDRGIRSDELEVAWQKEIGEIPGALALSFSGLQAGPGGAPIEIWIQGHDLEAMRKAAAALKEKLATYQGVYEIQDDYRMGKDEFRLYLKPEATPLGVTVADLAQQVFAGYFGAEAVRLQRGRDDVRIRVKYPFDERKTLDQLNEMRIRTPLGKEVPLRTVANLVYGPGVSTITRTDGMRRIAVTAKTDTERANTSEVIQSLQSYFAELMNQYGNIRISVQGEQENTRESLASLFTYYPIALVVLLIIIVTTFRSYLQPIIILLAIPYGMVGVVLGHLALGYNLSMMSLFGLVAVSGVVVNASIVMTDYFNQRLAEGTRVREALVQSGVRRMRPIFLTTATTVGGLAPMLREKDVQAQFLIPMAISIAAGVASSAVLSAFVTPCLLGIINDLRRFVRWMFTGKFPTPEEVEPAVIEAHQYEEEETPPPVSSPVIPE